MPTNKRLTDLTDFTSVLPYTSEMFGVYQPMIGWRSKRRKQRFSLGLDQNLGSLLQLIAQGFEGVMEAEAGPRPDGFPDAPAHDPCQARLVGTIGIGRPAGVHVISESSSVLMETVALTLPNDGHPVAEAWNDFVNAEQLRNVLALVTQRYLDEYRVKCRELNPLPPTPILTAAELVLQQKALLDLLRSLALRMEHESALAGALLALVEQGRFSQLEALFYKKPTSDTQSLNEQLASLLKSDDPFLTFDPKRDIKDVSLSPLGVVHLFRQYFFELDTFLGNPTGHVWLSPGSTVELIEVSTRRVFTERVIEQSTETTRRADSSATDRDEISEAVKNDNQSDLKLGASLTVNQSWGTGSSTATGSLNMENTQQTARETTHKRMREQTEKLSSEIKQNFKSTFKTITETTDTSSKRYVLTNATPDLINYELRRKMRQVGVQVQDIGTYLCWETFVDDPGLTLGLANLVHLAKPADLKAPPDQSEILAPPDKAVSFTTNLTWNFGDTRQINTLDGFLPLNNAVPMPPAPDGYEVRDPDSFIDVFQISKSRLQTTSGTGDRTCRLP